MKTRTLSFEIPEPKNGQCNPDCQFFTPACNSRGSYGNENDSCDLGYGILKTVKLEHPTTDLYDKKRFPASKCPWAE